MSANEYFDKIQQRLQGLKENQLENINKAAASMAASLAAGRAVYYFGSGHSTLPTLDVFPRYGSFVGIQPIYDNRLLWSNVIGPGGTPELLWIERQEGYMSNVLRYYNLDSRDTMIVISHGGLNAAPIEAALIAKEHGLTVIVITSVENWKQVKPTHSSGKHLADTADIVIDNGAPLEDSLITIPGWPEPVAASASVTVICISMALIAESARLLANQGIHLPTFVSPNLAKTPDHNLKVYEAYREFRKKII